ncbi:MAG TPA: alpha/beta hydrolase [Solirubrobacterales bacterium]|nr:alpha/beta hydrolase [Solirubrobacterales bacterium]
MAIVIAAGALGLATAVLGSGGASPASAEPVGESGARFEAAPCPQTPHPIPALKTARCGYLVVPANRARPNGKTIRNAVAIVPAVAKLPKPDPVVFMTGGPGAAAILDIPFLVDAGINKNRDLIVMAQRGTMFDQPEMFCPELDRFYARQVSLVYDAPSTGTKQAAAARACHDRLVKAGVDPSAYNTTENANDFADLRKALGIESWNVYGYSYGSDLALSFLRDHPEGIRTVTVDSVVPPNIVSLPWTWSSAREGITTIFAACEAEPRCERNYPDLLGTFTGLVRKLEARPLVRQVRPPQGGAPVKVVLDGGTIVNMLVSNVPRPPDVPAAIYELAEGKPQRFLEARAAGAVVPDDPEQAQGMTQSFICQEWAPYGGSGAILAAGRKQFPSFPASVLVNAPQLPFENQLCGGWKVPKAPASQRVRVRSDIPTLVVSGTFDSKTGAKWGRYAASSLSKSTYVRIDGIGHWVIVQSPCGQRIFQSFLAKPTSPQTACAAKTRPSPFTIGK